MSNFFFNEEFDMSDAGSLSPEKLAARAQRDHQMQSKVAKLMSNNYA
jgi:hypothetical protein